MANDVIFNDVFQWKNSAHKVSSVGAGSKFSTVNRDMSRDVDREHDFTEQQFSQDERTNDIADLVRLYSDHFDTGITITHREVIRESANKLFDRACEELYNKYVSNEEEIIAQERRRLADELCELRPELNRIAGSTRNCFSAHVIAHTMNDNSLQTSQLLAKLRNDAITAETQALQDTFDRKYMAHITADDADYNKYLQTLSLLKGAWHKIDYTDEVDERVDETITDLTFTLQWNRTASSISDAAGTYDGDIDAINAAGGGALAP